MCKTARPTPDPFVGAAASTPCGPSRTVPPVNRPAPPLRVPWSELAALAAAWVALVAVRDGAVSSPWSSAGLFALALVAALAPRRALEGPAPALTECASVAGAFASLAIAATVEGAHPPSGTLRLLFALCVGSALGMATLLALALPLDARALRRAMLPSVALGALVAWGLAPNIPAWIPAARAVPALGAWVAVLAFAHGVARPMPPLDRARLIVPGLGAGALASSLTVSAALGRGASPWVIALGLVALVLGLTLGAGAIALDRAALFARRSAAAAIGFAAGALLAWALPGAPVGAVLGGLLTMVLVWPEAERRLRPDEGRLLDACDAILRNLPQAETLTDLAAALLDPLRFAARNLRAPAALWVLDRAEVLRVDVAGGASTAVLSLESERALLSWLRARPVGVYADVLRPGVVRRPELRPVLAALDGHEALGALPLCDGAHLVAIVLLPRGARREVPSYEETARLEAVARAAEGTYARIAALHRAQERLHAAESARAAAEEGRALAAHRAEVMAARLTHPAPTAHLGDLDAAWIAYAPASRALEQRLDALAPDDGPVCLLAEPGAGVAAAARRLHGRSPRAAGPLVVVDCSALRVDAARAALLGDARSAQRREGLLAQAGGGTLVLCDLPALGHDALAALQEALATGQARSLGESSPYAVEARVVVSTRRPPEEVDLPRGLLRALEGRTVRTPPLRARREDLESLSLLGIDRACRVLGRAPVGLDPAALALLQAWHWPGNLPELWATLEFAVQRCRGTRLLPDDLPPSLRAINRGALLEEASSARHDA